MTPTLLPVVVPGCAVPPSTVTLISISFPSTVAETVDVPAFLAYTYPHSLTITLLGLVEVQLTSCLTYSNVRPYASPLESSSEYPPVTSPVRSESVTRLTSSACSFTTVSSILNVSVPAEVPLIMPFSYVKHEELSNAERERKSTFAVPPTGM